jgi:uncharacterized protein (TIGR02687 family)
MDTEKIIQDLNRRFAAPLPEYYHRRIIFWHDEDREFEDKLDEIQLDNAKLVALNGNNTFMVKKLLSNDDLASNYLVYNPLSFDKPDDDWLIDVKLYSEEFRADLISMWMDEMGLVSSFAMRKEVKHYRKFFNAKERREKVAAQSKTPEKPAQLHMAVMSAICGIKEPQQNRIMQCVLRAGLDNGSNPVYQKFVDYGAQDAFWAFVCRGTGYCEIEGDLGKLAIHLLLTASTQTMFPEYLAGLERFLSLPHQAYCYDFVSDWLRSEDNHQLYEITRYVEEEAHLPKRFSQLALEDLLDTECFPCIDEIILTKLMTEISNHIINVEIITKVVEKRRTCVWYEEFANFYEGILQVANMQEFFKEHSAGFHTAQAREVWKNYTNDYYRMDRYYRQFQLCFKRGLETSNILLDDLFKHVVDKVEGLYSHWFLGELGSNWSNVCADELAQYGKILEIPQQADFYRSRIKNKDSRIFIIISDAMRYEVAATLAEELERENQSQVKLDNVQSIFPSITKFGMAALLPHTKLSVEVKSDVLAVLADGQSTASTNRDKVLKAANPASVALQYKNIIGMKRAERSALVKGMDVVYIYHDTIDEASHTSDTAVFTACEKAISELKNIVRIIVNEFGGTNILITADHGFLYTYSPLNEDNKADKTSFNGMDVEYGRRYAIMQKGASPDYLMPVKFLDGETEFEGFAPRENIRIKMNGGGLNFVHGGISLQEMVVPVIDYHHLRNDSMEYKRNRQKYDTKPVTVSLLSASRKISNMIFSLNFYQKDAVGANREAATYQVYFTDSNGKQISDVQKIIADKVIDNGAERTFRCTFNLKPLKYSNTENYYLVIEDEQGLQLPQREEFQIDIAFAVEDFGFFG